MVREVLRRALDRFVAGSGPFDEDRHAGANLEAPGPQPSMKHGSRGAPVMNAIRPAFSETTHGARHLDVNTIPADMAVHEDGDKAVCGKTAADSKRRLSD